jgi:hypothetical protein
VRNSARIREGPLLGNHVTCVYVALQRKEAPCCYADQADKIKWMPVSRTDQNSDDSGSGVVNERRRAKRPLSPGVLIVRGETEGLTGDKDHQKIGAGLCPLWPNHY